MKLNILLEFPDGWVGGEMAKTRRTSMGGNNRYHYFMMVNFNLDK